VAVLPSGLPEQVGDDEDLARFLTSSGHYSDGGVRPNAFIPSPKGRSTSVSRHDRYPVDILKKLGEVAVAASGRRLHGAAIFKASAVRKAQLAVDASEPPDRHALIHGWPWIEEDDPRARKAQQMTQAQQLVTAAGQPLLFDQ